MTKSKIEPDSSTAISSGLAFTSLCNLRNNEGRLRWQSAQLGLILNVPGWTAAGLKIASKPTIYELTMLSVGCFVLAIANYFFRVLQRRDTKLMEFWNHSLLKLEKANGIEGRIKIFTSKQYKELEQSQERIGKNLRTLAVGSIFIWIGLGLMSAVLASSKGGLL